MENNQVGRRLQRISFTYISIFQYLGAPFRLHTYLYSANKDNPHFAEKVRIVIKQILINSERLHLSKC